MKTVVGVFPNNREAELTAQELEQIGLARSDITFVDRSSGSEDDFITQLKGYGVPEHQARLYAESIERGGTLESVRVRDEQVDDTLSIMRRHTTGLEGSEAASPSPSEMRRELGKERTGEDETISVIDEELVVGKREIERGGVKVTSRVREEPVETDVQLREERVTVERQPVDREIDPASADFRDETIEMVERAETPVVGKRARIVEEIKLRKDVAQRSESVKGTVRKMDVDVQPREGRPFDASEYRAHYDTLDDADASYDDYTPAYKFGHELRGDSRFTGERWDEVEPKARTAWEERNPNSWERFKAAVRHAWDKRK